ncbi:MAG TPA: hypothetical protein VHN15_08135 [Thermoanaerobaculia bacterium]|nr:hypothetical protein [Thermoanaerobaculia bacterium]
MKKREKKLQVRRETVQQLDLRALPRANGGIDWTGCVSGCGACPGDDNYTRPVMFEGAAVGAL